jgi:3-oxoadipate enol-lactonase
MVKDNDLLVKVNGTSISYEDNGQGVLPLVFIHGFPFSKTTWQPQMEALSKGHRVISYDIRGFGRSGSSKEIPSIDLYASDLLALMDALEIKKAIVCGLSMGGYILMNAIGRYPERFTGIILSDTQCIADSIEVKEKRYKAIRQIESEGLQKFADDFVKSVFCDETLEKRKDLVEETKKIILSTSPQTITGTLHALAQRRESCSLVKRISIPSLILCGKKDNVTPVTQSELLFNSITNSKMHTIENAGHLANLEQPEDFNEHVRNFVNSF